MPEVVFREREWAQAGKALLFSSGLACICLASFQGDGSLALLLKAWVGLFGALCVLVALLDARPGPS